jgi:N-methylhydantoinase A/oxoprolinase/acetone carboxylase beta subunit
MKAVIVPRNAGVLSAFGLLLADSIKDDLRSVLSPLDKLTGRKAEDLFLEMERRGLRELAADGFPRDRIVLERSADLRYAGQSYEITVPWPRTGVRGLPAAFEREHRKSYSYFHAGMAIEIVAVRLQSRGLSEKIRLRRAPLAVRPDPGPASRKRQALVHGGRRFAAPVYDRERLVPGSRIPGPALIVDPGSTTYLPPGLAARVDGFENLILAGA